MRKNKWIPVTERPPKNGEDVLVSVADGVGILVGHWNKAEEYWKVYGTYGAVEVEAWQPLPPAYNPDDINA